MAPFYGREALDAWRFLPPNGWRLVHEDATTTVYTAPEPGAVGEWAVASVRLEGGVWRASGAERNLFPHTTGSVQVSDLELVWPSEQIIVRGRSAQLFAKVKNNGHEPWLADYKEPLTVVAWLIDLPSNRRLLAWPAPISRRRSTACVRARSSSPLRRQSSFPSRSRPSRQRPSCRAPTASSAGSSG